MRRRLGNAVSGWIVGVLLLAALGGNVAMLPYRIWFRIVMLAVIPAAIVAGHRLAKPRTVGPSESVRVAPFRVIDVGGREVDS